MTDLEFKKILACPKCKKKIGSSHQKDCTFKKKTFIKSGNIWDFISIEHKKNQSQIANELMHQKGSWGRVSDGSYETLATFARGNKTVDIACGEGWIEQLAPETVGVDFSISALKKAQKNGAKYLVCASAEKLPFVDNAFDLAICAGSLENIENPQKAICEMARVSKIQILTVHREFNFPLAKYLRRLFTALFKIKHQPIEKPITAKELKIMLTKTKLNVVFWGYWTLPVNYGRIVRFLPTPKNVPSCFFTITYKS